MGVLFYSNGNNIKIVVVLYDFPLNVYTNLIQELTESVCKIVLMESWLDHLY